MEKAEEFKVLSVVIPVYNEEKTLQDVLSRVESVDIKGLRREVIIIDDASTDKTPQLLKELELMGLYKIIYHEKNQGKGAALRSGFKAVTGDIVIIQDADLEYDPAEYTQLLLPILDGHADVVYGSRLSGGKTVRAFKYSHLLGNKFLTFVTNILYDTTLTDMETCYKVFKTEVIKNIEIKSDRFNFEPEFTAKICKKGYKIYELPISYYGRDFDEGKKITWKDGFPALWALIKYRFVD